MGQMTADQYLDQIQNRLMKTLTEKKDAMPPGFNQQRFALNCITVIRDMMKDYKKREQLQTVDINSILAEIRTNAGNELADDTARYEEELKEYYEAQTKEISP